MLLDFYGFPDSALVLELDRGLFPVDVVVLFERVFDDG